METEVRARKKKDDGSIVDTGFRYDFRVRFNRESWGVA